MKPIAKVIGVTGNKVVALGLSRDDAVLLRELLGRAIAGGPTKPIYEALRKAGVPGRSQLGEEGVMQIPSYDLKDWRPPSKSKWSAWRNSKKWELAK